MAGVCSVEECERPSWSRSWCQAHYSRWWRNGWVRPDLPIGARPPLAANPWAGFAPPCPLCGGTALTFLWAWDSDLRWYCMPCDRRFDPASAKAPTDAQRDGPDGIPYVGGPLGAARPLRSSPSEPARPGRSISHA